MVRSLQGRIDGIKERQRLLVDNWASHTAQPTASDGGHPTLTDDEIQRIKDDPVLTVSDFEGADP